MSRAKRLLQRCILELVRAADYHEHLRTSETPVSGFLPARDLTLQPLGVVLVQASFWGADEIPHIKVSSFIFLLLVYLLASVGTRRWFLFRGSITGVACL